MSTTAEILESALTLPQKERAALALQLLESLDELAEDRVEEETEQSLVVDVARRLDEVRTGKVATVDGQTAIAPIREELRRGPALSCKDRLGVPQTVRYRFVRRGGRRDMTVAEIKKSFQGLSLEERLLLLHELWDDVASDETSLDLSADEQAELEQRYAEHIADPSSAKKWENVRTEIRSRH